MLLLHHLMDWIQSSRTIVAHKHGSTALVALCEDLGAAATSAHAIILANCLIAQVVDASFVASLDDGVLFLYKIVLLRFLLSIRRYLIRVSLIQ